MKIHIQAALAAGAICMGSSLAPVGANTKMIALVASNATASMTEIAEAYMNSHPGVTVQISPAGSKVIVAEVAMGAEADLVLVSKEFADSAKGVEAPILMFSNHTVVSANKGGKVKTAQDLAKSGIRLVGGTSGSVENSITSATLASLSKTYGADFAVKANANIETSKTSLEQAQKAIEDGAVDAGIVFAADASTGKANLIDLGDRTVVVKYEAAVVSASKNAGNARDFLTFMSGSEGQAIFRKHHHDVGR